MYNEKVVKMYGNSMYETKVEVRENGIKIVDRFESITIEIPYQYNGQPRHHDLDISIHGDGFLETKGFKVEMNWASIGSVEIEEVKLWAEAFNLAVSMLEKLNKRIPKVVEDQKNYMDELNYRAYLDVVKKNKDQEKIFEATKKEAECEIEMKICHLCKQPGAEQIWEDYSQPILTAYKFKTGKGIDFMWHKECIEKVVKSLENILCPKCSRYPDGTSPNPRFATKAVYGDIGHSSYTSRGHLWNCPICMQRSRLDKDTVLRLIFWNTWKLRAIPSKLSEPTLNAPKETELRNYPLKWEE